MTERHTAPVGRQVASGVASPKFFLEKIFWGTKCLLWASNSIFVCDAASQSTKWLDMLKILTCGPLAPPGYAYTSSFKKRSAEQAIKSEPGRAGKLLLFVLSKPAKPCILVSRLQKATVTLSISVLRLWIHQHVKCVQGPMAARPDHHFQLEPHKSHWLEGIFRMRKYLRVCKSLMEDVAPATYPGGSKSRQVIFI